MLSIQYKKISFQLIVEMISFACKGSDCYSFIAITERTRAIGGGMEGKFLEGAVLPAEVEGKTAAGFDTYYFPVGEGCRQGGKDLEDAPGVALQQHFCQSGGAAEVAVDLEGGVSVEHIWIDAAMFAGGADGVGEEFVEEFERMIAFL